MGIAMRLAGRINEWNDAKGFGFVMPNGGGDRAFVHVKAFQRGSRRPAEGDLISYRPSRDQRGRLNATQIRHAGQRIEAPRAPSRFPRAALGGSALAAALVAAASNLVPLLLAGVYVVASTLAYLMYAADKSAARSGRQRIPEGTLHLVGLLGGWPGALVAQQRFRHKTIKQPFQAVFWTTVVVNLVAVGWAVSSGHAAEAAASIGG